MTANEKTIKKFWLAWDSGNIDQACWFAAQNNSSPGDLFIEFEIGEKDGTALVTAQDPIRGKRILAEWDLADITVYYDHETNTNMNSRYLYTHTYKEEQELTLDPFPNMPANIVRLLQATTIPEYIIDAVKENFQSMDEETETALRELF